MEFIIWLIVLAFIIIKVKNNGADVEKRQKVNKRLEEAYEKAAGSEKEYEKLKKAQKKVYETYNKSAKKVKHAEKTNWTKPNKRPEAPKNPIQITDNPSSNPEDLIAQGDILSAANAEVNKQHTEDHNKVLVNQMKDITKPSFDIDRTTEGAEERMKKVRDLMIMGYGGNLEFQRDFVAEGMDLINKYTAGY